MWIPKTEEEIVQAVITGAVEESSVLDAKRELGTNNREIAKDIAAMANNGGVLIYGIAEDENGKPTILNPIPIAGQRERITAIVRSSVVEPPQFNIHTITTLSDVSLGYIVVVIPPSERAPHMVEVKGENRYYGRTASGNIPLTEGEVARLYERRQRWEVDREAILEAEIKRVEIKSREFSACLYIFAQPIFREENLLFRVESGNTNIQSVLTNCVDEVASAAIFRRNYTPDFYFPSHWIRRTEGFFTKLGSSTDEDPAGILDLQVDFDGSIHVFCSRAAELIDKQFLFFPTLVVGILTRSLAFSGKLYSKAQYLGRVNTGIALIGLKGSKIGENVRPVELRRPYDRNEYRRTACVSTLALEQDYKETAKSLLTPLFDAITQGRLSLFDG